MSHKPDWKIALTQTIGYRAAEAPRRYMPARMVYRTQHQKFPSNEGPE